MRFTACSAHALRTQCTNIALGSLCDLSFSWILSLLAQENFSMAGSDDRLLILIIFTCFLWQPWNASVHIQYPAASQVQ